MTDSLQKFLTSQQGTMKMNFSLTFSEAIEIEARGSLWKSLVIGVCPGQHVILEKEQFNEKQLERKVITSSVFAFEL